MACNYYYNTNPDQPQVADKTWVAIYGGIDPATSTPEQLAAAGYYCYVSTEPPSYDAKLYSLDSTWVITGTDASEDYTVVELPLPDAKANCVSYEQGLAAEQTQTLSTESGYSESILTTAASLPEVSRPAEIQTVLDAQTVVMTELMENIAAIEAATTIDELNNIVNPPTGILFTGRGNGLGPEDLNVSYYTEFNSTSMTEAETELYIPSTATTIPYGSGGPNAFDSMGNAFNPGGPYTMQIRETATSRVIAEIVVPLNPAGEDVVF